MADLGSLAIQVDVSSLTAANRSISTFSATITRLATSMSTLAKNINGIQASLLSLASGARAVDGALSPLANQLAGFNRQTNAAQTKKLTNLSNSLDRFANSARDASKEAAGLKLPSVFAPGGAAPIGRTSPAGGGFGGDILRARAGVAVTGGAGVNPFAAGMINLPPQAAAAAVAIGAVVGVAKTAADSIIALGSAAIETGLRFERLRSMLTVAAGGLAGARTEFEYISGVSLKMGLNLEQATEGYAKFRVAANGAGLEVGKTKLIFESMAKATTAMGLTTSDQSRVFLALEQMLSKGKVSAEELRRQLGNALPGAFTLMAKAAQTAGISVTGSTGELEKLMKAGKLISAEVLPAFAVEVEKAFGAGFQANIDNLRSNVNRLETSWGLFLKGIADLGLMDAANIAVKGIGSAVSDLVQWIQKLSTTVEGAALSIAFKELGSSVASAAGDISRLITGTSSSDILAVANAISTVASAARGAVDGFVLLSAAAMPFMLQFKGFAKAAGASGSRAWDGVFAPGGGKSLEQQAKEMEDARKRQEDYLKSPKKGIFDAGMTIAPIVAGDTTSSAITGESKLSAEVAKREALMRKIESYYAKEEQDIKKLVSLELDRAGVRDTQGRAYLGTLLEGIYRSEQMEKSAKAEVQAWQDKLNILRQVGDVEKILADQQQRASGGKGAFELSDDLKAQMSAYEQLDKMLGRTVGRKDVTTGLLRDAMDEYLSKGKITLSQYNNLLTQIEQKANDTADTLYKKIGGVLADFASSAIDSLFGVTMSFRDMVKDMIKQIAKLIFWYGVLIPLIKSVFGGAGGQGGWGDAIVSAFSGKASGGPVSGSSAYMVGERGPEMFVPGRSGTIIPNGALRAGNAGGPITVMVNVDAKGSSSDSKGGDTDRSRDAKTFGLRIGDAIRSVIVDELRPGGLIKEGVR